MPFTLAHAAVALPSRRLRLVPSAVVAGALAPDVWYYLPRAWTPTFPPAWSPHSWTGAATLDLVVAVALVALWRVALRRPWLALLPAPLSAAALVQTAQPVLRRNPPASTAADLGRVVGSALLGVASHLALDLITHDTGLDAWSWASLPVAGHAVHDWLQVALSVVGLGLLALGAWRWARGGWTGSAVRWPPGSRVVLALAVVAGALAAVRRADLGGLPATATASDLVAMLLGGTAGVLAVLLLYAVGWWAVRVTRRPRRRAGPATSPAAPRASRTLG